MCSLGLRCCGWQFDPEGAAGAVGFEANFAAHALDRFADNCQANASPFETLIRVDTLEQAKEAALVLRFNADAVVFYREADLLCPALGENLD